MTGAPQRATIVGAGGLGGPIAFALAAAEIAVTICDGDRVELSNLPRQLQFTAADIGQPKASRLAAAVGARAIDRHWTTDAAEPTDLIIDATDDPVTKFAIADWAMRTGRPYVIAAALRFGGNVMAGAPGHACYRCLFEEPAEVASCADAGVLGPVVGAIGGLAGAVALQLLAGDLQLAGAILVLDDLRADDAPRIVRFAPRADCRCAA